jgi:antitoxin MazE
MAFIREIEDLMRCAPGQFWRYVARGCAALTTKQARNYNVAMKTRIVKIGNSQGVRIPKLLLERSNLAEEVEIEAEDNRIIIRSTKQPRQDWERAFRAMAERGDDSLLDSDVHAQTQWDEDEWQW